jgi:hypothetical protein
MLIDLSYRIVSDRMLALLLVFALQALAQTDDVSSLTVSQPQLVCQLDMNVLKGEVRRLSWSPDGLYVHVQTIDRSALYNYIVALDDKEISLAFGEPEWAAAYWARKADLSAPGEPGLKIEVIETHQRTRPAPFAGGFAAGGAQTVDQRNPNDTFAIEVSLKLLGEEVGYFLNDVAYGGITYGWGPAGSGLLVFADAKGRLALFDRQRHKKAVPGTKDAVLPAWSPDGSQVAFLQKDGRRNYRLMTTAVARPTP